jgi:membrane fusion protein (multidrug efflux system)
MKRRIVVASVFLLVALLCGGLVWFNFFRDKMIAEFFAGMKPPPQTVSATEVQAKTWTPGITAIGTTRAANGVQLAAEIAGLVKEIRFKANDRVAAGQVLVQLDDAIERADLLEAESSIKLSQATLSRRQTLRARGYDSEASYDEAEASLSTAKSKLAKTQAVIDQKALKAPFAGTIGIARIDPGQYVQPGTVVATLQNLDSMRVDFTVPQQMAGQVKIGQTVRFGLAEADLPFVGKITGIDPRVDPQTRLIAVQALLDNNRGGDLLPGQFVHVRVELPAEPNIVTVPQTAAVTSLYGDYVFVVQKDGEAQTAKQVFVKLGRRNGSELEIASGLQPGQTVVVSGQNKLQAGSAVKIDNSVDLQRLAETERRLQAEVAR